MAATILCVFYLAFKDPYQMLMKYSEINQTEVLVSIGLLLHVGKRKGEKMDGRNVRYMDE
jgi:hypothetical protein